MKGREEDYNNNKSGIGYGCLIKVKGHPYTHTSIPHVEEEEAAEDPSRGV